MGLYDRDYMKHDWAESRRRISLAVAEPPRKAVTAPGRGVCGLLAWTIGGTWLAWRFLDLCAHSASGTFGGTEIERQVAWAAARAREALGSELLGFELNGRGLAHVHTLVTHTVFGGTIGGAAAAIATLVAFGRDLERRGPWRFVGLAAAAVAGSVVLGLLARPHAWMSGPWAIVTALAVAAAAVPGESLRRRLAALACAAALVSGVAARVTGTHMLDVQTWAGAAAGIAFAVVVRRRRVREVHSAPPIGQATSRMGEALPPLVGVAVRRPQPTDRHRGRAAAG